MTLLVHRPWRASTPPRLSKEQWIKEFNNFLSDSCCPQSVKIAHARVRERKVKKRHSEPTAEVLTPWDTYVRIHTYGAYGDQTTDSVPSLLTVDPWANDISDGPFFIYVGPINLY